MAPSPRRPRTASPVRASSSTRSSSRTSRPRATTSWTSVVPRRPGPRRKQPSPRPSPGGSRSRPASWPRSRSPSPIASSRSSRLKALTDAAAANAAASGPLSQAAKDQEVIAAQGQVATRRAQLKDRELDTEIRKPADAARYAVEQHAAAEKAREIAEAEASAETVRLSGAAERERRTALADATRAEADAMTRKAAAYEGYGEAAIIDIVAETLPKVVAEAAKPMSQIGSMTVISTDGASRTVKTVASTIAQGQELTKSMLGVDLGSLLQSFVGSQAPSAAEAEPLDGKAGEAAPSDSLPAATSPA